MANGAMIEQIRKILEEEDSIPQSVTNKLVLAAIVESYRTREHRFDILEKSLQAVDDCNKDEHKAICADIEEIKKEQTSLSVAFEERQQRAVTFGWILDKFGIPIIMLIIAGLVSAWVSGAFN